MNKVVYFNVQNELYAIEKMIQKLQRENGKHNKSTFLWKCLRVYRNRSQNTITKVKFKEKTNDIVEFVFSPIHCCSIWYYAIELVHEEKRSIT